MTDSLKELRELLLGEEQQKIESLEHKIEQKQLTPEQLGELLPDAFLSKTSDKRLIRALEAPVSESVRASIIRDTDAFAELLFPVMSPAIRRSIVETVRSMMQNISQVIDQSFSLRGLSWRLESLRTNVPFHEIVLRNTLLYRVEQVFLIHNDSGLLISHLSADEAISQDPDAVSAMLTAIQDFTSDSFATGEGEDHLAKIDTESHTIWITPGREAHLACVISGIPPSDLRNHFSDVLTDIHQDFGDKLKEYRGDKDDFILADELLRSCLLSEQKEPEKKRGISVVILPLIILAIVAVIAWFGYRAYEQRERFEALQQSLAGIPGITLLDAAIDGDSFSFSGLRDPLSDDPRDILAREHSGNESIDMQWRPYLSLEEPLLARRAVDSLQPPQGVSLEIHSGVVQASGTATRQWRQKCRDIAPALPGISHCDTSQVQDLDTVLLGEATAALNPPQSVTLSVEQQILQVDGRAPKAWIDSLGENIASVSAIREVRTDGLSPLESDELERLAEEIGQSHVYFGSNSSEVIDDDQSGQVIASITRAAELGTLLERDIRIIITGRTFGDSKNPANIELARNRAETFERLLIGEYDVPERFLVIDQARPPEVADARLNDRRLDFVVVTTQ